MSDLLAAAAAALGAPEDLVSRSAAARAVAQGTSEDAVLSAWSGGAALPEAQVGAAPETEVAPEAVADEPPIVEPDPSVSGVAAPTADTPGVAPMAPAPGPTATPVLTGQRGHPLMALIGIAGLFVIGLLITLIIPGSISDDFRHFVPNAEISTVGQAGLEVYLQEGCWYCHTQLVRPVLADVGLGPVTENFSDSLDTAAFGIQRIGPDLAHIGSRSSFEDEQAPLGASDLEALLIDPHEVFPEGIHPSYTYLSDGDLAALTTYLLELK